MVTHYIDAQGNKLLFDFKGKKINPWKEKKDKTILLSESYYRLKHSKKSVNVMNCGSLLEFYRFKDNTLKLNYANFCKDRLCPLCSWRRSKKIFGQTSKIMNKITEDKDTEFLFLTLTVKNVYGYDLSKTLDALFYGYKKFFQLKELKKISLGTFRALEVTYSHERGDFHPHIHCIIAVNKSYFTSQYYLSIDKLKFLWSTCMNLDYIPQVDLRKVKGNKQRAVCEVAKYSVKDSDYLIPGNEPLTDYLVDVFTITLFKRRLVSFSGIFRKYHKLLNLDDTDSGDLINTDNDEINNDLKFVIERYKWNVGIGNYKLVNDFEEE